MPIYHLMPFITPFCAKGEMNSSNVFIFLEFSGFRNEFISSYWKYTIVFRFYLNLQVVFMC